LYLKKVKGSDSLLRVTDLGTRINRAIEENSLPSIDLAINGAAGIIGSTIAMIAFEINKRADRSPIRLALNASRSPEEMAYLLSLSSIYGKSRIRIEATQDGLLVGKGEHELFVPLLNYRNPAEIPWNRYSNEIIVADTTGQFTTTELASGHLGSGALKVVISSPSKSEPMAEFVVGSNNHLYVPGTTIFGGASCTTNCVASVVKTLNDAFGVDAVMVTSTHALTSSQEIEDKPTGNDPRKKRQALENIIPTSTGAAKKLPKVVPGYSGAVGGIAFRVPVAAGSAVTLDVDLGKPISLEEVLQVLRDASRGVLKGVLEYDDSGQRTSIDIIGNPHSAVLDTKSCLQVTNKRVTLTLLYDNIFMYALRLIELIFDAVSADRGLPSPFGTIFENPTT
jgi:glyceraldehyde-3-phosphate dehydrogenase type I